MRLHRFFVEDLKKKSRNSKEKIKFFSILSKDLLNQWKNVFRFRVGDTAILFDGSSQEFICVFIKISRDEAELQVSEVIQNNNKTKRQIVLFASVLKKDNFEFVLEKATELGVSFIVPVISERTLKMGLRMDRLRKIIEEATEQSGWPKPPQISDTVYLEQAFDIFPDYKKIAFDESGKKFDGGLVAEDRLGIFIGPEGGWGESDFNIFDKNGIELFSLGEQTLRAETASLAILSVLLIN